jgi:uncharacterized membrane protein
MTLGERVSDKISMRLGSWPFILGQSAAILIWIIFNVFAVVELRWDAYPFILLNLMLSLQAAYAGPLILMSQRRVEARDREFIHHDFELAREFEAKSGAFLRKLEAHDLAMQDQLIRLTLLIREAALALRTLQEGRDEGR